MLCLWAVYEANIKGIIGENCLIRGKKKIQGILLVYYNYNLGSKIMQKNKTPTDIIQCRE